MSNPHKILVIRLSSLGDVLMTIPAVQAIRNTYRESHISWLVEGSVGQFLSYQSFIDNVIEFPRKTITSAFKNNALRGIQETNKFIKKLRETKYDLIVDFHGIIKSAMFSTLAKSRKKIGFGRTYAKEYSHLFYDETVSSNQMRIHKVERNMLIARRLWANGNVPRVSLTVPDSFHVYIDDFFSRSGLSSPVFAVNPFSSSGSSFKRWSLERYHEIITRIQKNMGAQVLILWGPGEKNEAEQLQRMGDNTAVLSCPTNIPQLFALLRKIDMYIGGDTGVMHLAALAGCPMVSIFGPTDVSINAPYSENCSLLRKDLPCSPCKNKDCRERKCLSEVTVEEVFEAIQKMNNNRLMTHN